MTPALDRALERLGSAQWPLEQRVRTYLALDAAVDTELFQAKARVLKSAIAWGGEGQALAAKAHETAATLASLGVILAENLSGRALTEEEEARLVEVIQVALANFAAVVRWSAMIRTGERPFAFRPVHALFRLAERLGVAFAPAVVVRDGVPRVLTTEAHYLRALVMPLFCPRTLDPQEMELADTWLWQWVGDYRLTRALEGGEARLWVDLDAETGVDLRQFHSDGRHVRHLVLARLARNIPAVTASFHAGRVYAGTPITTEFPMEAQAAVLDHVQKLWTLLQEGAPRRRHERREPHERRVQCYIGLADVLGRGFGHAMLSDRWIEVRDESDGGASVMLDGETWDQVWHGDIIGLRAADQSQPRIGIVVRKFQSPDGSGIGLEWVATAPKHLFASEIRQATGKVERRIACLYIADRDDTGRSDRILIDDSAFLHDNRYELAFSDRVFEVRLNRVLLRGRGWVSAGFALLGAKRPGLHVAHA